jgi:hypothetical protein
MTDKSDWTPEELDKLIEIGVELAMIALATGATLEEITGGVAAAAQQALCEELRHQ